MVQLNKISLLFVAAVLFFGISQTAEAAGLNHKGDFRLAETEQQSTVYPDEKPELFGIQRQGSSAVELVRVLSVPNAKKSSDDENPNPGLLSEIPLRRAVSIYLCFSGTIHQSLSIRELLFPFHHFL
jgi:hypothetical protein